MHRYILYALVVLLVGSAAGADTVRLKNGRQYENVIARTEGDSVFIRFSFGELGIPARLVAEVETAESTLALYLTASRTLETASWATAEDWLELAIEARRAGLDDGYRRAVQKAAELDPRHPDLVAHMGALDWVFDDETGQWVGYGQRLVDRRAAERRHLQDRLAARELAESETRRRLIEALEVMALADAAQALTDRAHAASEPAAVQGIPLYGGWYGVPFAGHRPHHGGPRVQQPERPRGEETPGPAQEGGPTRRLYTELSKRQPGSVGTIPQAKAIRRSAGRSGD